MTAYRPTRSSVRRRLGWLMAGLLALSVVLPLIPYAVAQKQDDDPAGRVGTEIPIPNPGAALWSELREGSSGISRIGGISTGVLIADQGQRWRELREGPLVTYGGWVLIGVVLVLVLLYLVRGSVRIDGGRSGRQVPRWTLFERVLHWYTAILFIILAVTGLSLLFGRYVLIPMMGLEGFSTYAWIAKNLHNYVGPAFSVGVLVMLVVWFTSNLPERTDFAWLLRAGGYFSKHSHPHAGKINAGEKIIVYWLMATVGLVAIASGFVLDFPNFDQSRELMQLSHISHAISTIVWMAIIVGHIYMGSVGVEGAFDGMRSGWVDARWAEQHHDLWYEKVKEQERAGGPAVPSSPAATEQPT